MAVMQHSKKRPDKHPWVAKLFDRMSAKQAAIAITNETAGIAWAITVHGYEAGHRAPNWGHFFLCCCAVGWVGWSQAAGRMRRGRFLHVER